ncbi:MAG: glycosyltransferase family 4 protein [Bacteroidota bacterium]
MKHKLICFFNCTKAWGGGEEWHFSMAKALHADGYSVLVVADPEGLLYQKCMLVGIRVAGCQVSNLSFLDPLKISNVAEIFREQAVDSLIINSSAGLKLAGLVGKLLSVRNIIYRRGLAAPVKNSILNRYLFKKVIDKIIVNSEATKEKLLENNARLIDSNKITTIYNGLDINDFDEQPTSFKYEAKKDQIILGNMGRMVEQKNQVVLIDLALALKKEGIDFKILIAGSGPLEAELKTLAEDKRVTDNIEFCGFVSDRKGFMDVIDIFVLPSLWEGFGYVLIEAMAASKPVVAFSFSSNPEVIEDGNTGLLSQPDDNHHLSQKIIQLIKDPDLRKNMGKAGRERVESEFTFDIGKLELLKLLEISPEKLP